MFKVLIKDISYFFESIRKAITYFRFSLKLKTAIHLAILKQNAFNRTYYVILDHEDNPHPFTKREIRYMQMKGYIPKELPFYEIKSRALFYTCSKTKEQMSKEERKEKRKDYLEYAEAMRKKKKNIRKERRRMKRELK